MVELVTDLTTQAFIAALKQLMERRGRVSDIGLGQRYKLKKINNNNELIDTSVSHNMNWHVIPPNALNFDRLREAKGHLKRLNQF